MRVGHTDSAIVRLVDEQDRALVGDDDEEDVRSILGQSAQRASDMHGHVAPNRTLYRKHSE